ncbi:MAG: hypothetical protein ACXU86_20775 [Archangium sp.]
MRKLSLLSLSLLSLLSLSSPALAGSPPPNFTAQHLVTRTVVMQMQAHVQPSTISAQAAASQVPTIQDSTGAGAITAQQLADAMAQSQAHAAADLPPVSVGMTLEQLAPLLVKLAVSGQWMALVAALILGAIVVLLTVGGVRALVGRFIPILLTDRAGVVLSAVAGQLASIVTAAASGLPISISMVLGLLASLLASGAYTMAKRAAAPSDKPAAELAPTVQ